MRRAGLRTRVVAAFSAGAMLLSAAVALISYQIIRESLVDARERSTVRAAYFDATVVRAELGPGNGDVLEVLRLLGTGGNRRAVVRMDGRWHARSADAGLTDAVPASLRAQVDSGRAGVQRVHADGQPAVVVGIPVAEGTAFYEIDFLVELDRTLSTLALVLATVAVLTGAAGAALGWYCTRYVLRPLTRVTTAAKEITGGELGTRLDPAAEPDLGVLATSFNRMVDELATRIERDRRFAADVSHELRSPLQTLAATASVLQRGSDRLEPRMNTAVHLMTGEIDRFQALVNDLLELSRGDNPADRAPVDMVGLAREACRGCGIPEDIVVVAESTGAWLVDRRRIRQVLTNLLHNAVRYGGGPVALRLGHRGGVCYVEVDDAGPGVRPDDRDVIFDRFVRGRPAHARGTGDGTGLGLALVAQHAAAHGGSAQVLDRPGGGARFRVELPGCLP